MAGQEGMITGGFVRSFLVMCDKGGENNNFVDSTGGKGDTRTEE